MKWLVTLCILILTAIGCLVVIIYVARVANAHSWYSQKQDPVWRTGCCGGSDCRELVLRPANYIVETAGVRIILSLEETRLVNSDSAYPVNALVTWDRVQPSEDGNWHICLFSTHRHDARGGIICLFMPPNG